MNKRNPKDVWSKPPKNAEMEIRDMAKKMIRGVFTCNPTPLCYWCPFSMYYENLCEESSDWKPKTK